MVPPHTVPYVDLVGQHAGIRSELLQAFAHVLDHGQFVLGSEVEQFEAQFAKLCGTRYAVGVNSGLDALVLALRAHDIGSGDEVITAANSFVASAGAIALVGAKPVFVDVRSDFNLDPAHLDSAVTPRTKAIMPVHLTGRPADMDAIAAVADRHGLAMIEDAAQAVGAKYKDRRVGGLGTVGAFSLHPLKTLNACGDGGVITTNDSAIHRRLRALRNHGLHNRDDCREWGHNSRLDTIHAAILLVKLRYFDAWTEKRRANAAYYQDALRDIPELVLPADGPNEHAVYHTFILQTDRRNALEDHLKNCGVGSAIHYPVPIHLQPAASGLGYRSGDFPVAEHQASRILSLPVHHLLDPVDLRYVSDSIRRFFRA